MFGPIKAVAIDDEPSHLLSIMTGLASVGIPCMGYWYDRDTSALCPEPPAGGLPHLRIVFSDLNLAELGGIPETQSLWSVIVGILKQIVSKGSGPYLLIFWTGVQARAAEVREMLYSRADQLDGIPCPIDILEMPKAPYLVSPRMGREFDQELGAFLSELHSKIGPMRRMLESSVQTNANLNAVSSWENRAAEAATLAVNEVHRVARGDDPDPTSGNVSLTKVVARIAVAASGLPAAKADPARALDAGMIDIMVDQFGVTVGVPGYREIIKSALGDTISEKINFNDNNIINADLNTFFQIDREVSSVKSWDRGAVIPVKSPIDTNALGFRPIELLTAEFLYPHELFPDEEHERIKEDLQRVQRSGAFVLVEIGAECDHAQDNYRTRRFLVGMEIPDDLVHLARPKTDERLRNGALELLGPWRIGGAVKYLLVSCRRFWTWQKRTPPQVEVLYRLRASMVSKLLHRYSSWSSRPGIVEFR